VEGGWVFEDGAGAVGWQVGCEEDSQYGSAHWWKSGGEDGGLMVKGMSRS